MRSSSSTALPSIYALIMVATFVTGGNIAPVAVAQDRGSDQDADRGESGEPRRGGWWSSRRDRSRRDRNREEGSDESSGRDSADARKSSARESDDSPGMATETYAKRLIGDLDKNGNKVLDGDELAKHRRRHELDAAEVEDDLLFLALAQDRVEIVKQPLQLLRIDQPFVEDANGEDVVFGVGVNRHGQSTLNGTVNTLENGSPKSAAPR